MPDQNNGKRPGTPGPGDGGGATDVDGLEASELPDGGRGPVETKFGKEAARKLPGETGGIIGGDSGLAGTPADTDARKHGSPSQS